MGAGGLHCIRGNRAKTTMATATSITTVSTLGRLLRQWRQVRGLSQLELALATGISSKHLSFVETGRAQPGRDVVLRLASALDLPLRDRNAALMAAGDAPLYGQNRLDSPEMAPVARAVEFMLRQQEPYPVVVADRLANALRRNQATERLLTHLLGPDRESECMNLYRLVLSPTGLRPMIRNFEDVARQVVMRVRREMLGHAHLARGPVVPGGAAQPARPARRLQRRRARDGRPAGGDHHPREGRPRDLALPHHHDAGHAQDVTLQELRIETSFPADAQTEAFLRALSA